MDTVSGRFQVHTVGLGFPENLSPEGLVGAEGGTRTSTGLPTPLKIALFSRCLHSVRFLLHHI